MDADRFDAIARRLARPSTRRRLMGLIGGGVAAMVARTGDVSAQNGDCASFCRQLPPGPERGRCVSDAAHGQGLCYQCGPAAPAGSGTLCGTACVDTTSDDANCGGCGVSCPAGETCQNGGCVSPCAAGFTDCGGSCYDLSSDASHCGTCDHACISGGVCVNGECSCPSNTTYCASSDSCVYSYCGSYRTVYNPETCQCECPAPYIALANTGFCAIPCQSDADCGGNPGSCQTTTEGQQVCNCGYSAYNGCTDYYPCTSSSFCQSCAFAVNTYCSTDGVCGTTC